MFNSVTLVLACLIQVEDRQLTRARANVGGDWDNSSYCGSRCVNVNNSSANVNANYGGRLSALILNTGSLIVALGCISSWVFYLGAIAKIHNENTPWTNVACANVRGVIMTKKLGNLYEQILSLDNLRLAFNKAAKGKRSYRHVLRIENNLDYYLSEIQRMLREQTFTTSPYRTKIIYAPKLRVIYVLPFYPDRIIQHALMNIMEPYFERWFYNHSLACRKGKGIHSGSRMTMRYVSNYSYCLKGDFSKFYPSIRHDIIKSMLAHKIKDKRILWLFYNIIDSVGDDRNIPIGNYVSQWLGNLYLNEFDRYCYEKLHVHNYIRYCDDFVIFSNDKEYLRQCATYLGKFVDSKLGLTFSKLNLFPVSHGVDFLGYRHFPDKILLRKSTAIRIKRRLVLLHHKLINKSISKEYAVGVIASIRGWVQHAYTFNFCKSIHLLELERMVNEYEEI